MGSWAMRGTRLHYNQSLSYTASQEMLLNIVRMRYGETPTFFDLPSIISQTEASVTGAAGQKKALNGVVDGVFSLRDNPTLSYHPRTGDDLGASILKAIKAQAILDVAPGNDTRTFLLSFVDSINGVRNSPAATSPASRVLESNDEFRYAVDLYVGLQNRGAVVVKVATKDEKPQGSPIPATNVLTLDMFTASDKGYLFDVEGDRAVLLKRSRFAALTIKPNEIDTPEVQELQRVFRLDRGTFVYRVKSQEDDEINLNPAAVDDGPQPQAADLPLVLRNPEAGPMGDADVEELPAPPAGVVATGPAPDVAAMAALETTGTLTINVRSGYQALAFLSKGVDVPEAHVRRGTVRGFTALDGRPFDARQLTRGLFHVCVQKHRPWHSDLAVHYRGHWFYIPETDVQSRATLNFIKFMIDVRSEAGSSPVMTLPVN
ncbi:MAG TPA: hypothetical protein DC048_03580 [Planctomycetaceae bacterium]|nr:hypothetical protein [Planctomycetaceae bacterium]